MELTWKRAGRAAARAGILLAIAAAVAACSGDFRPSSVLPPDAATTQGAQVQVIFNIVYLIGAAIFLLVEGLIVFSVLRYRRKKGDDELPPQIHGNNKLEILWTAIPVATVLALFVLSWTTLNSIDARQPNPPLKVGVVAYQWQWQFIYAPATVDRWENCSLPENAGKCVTIFGVGPGSDPATGRPNQNDPKWQPPQLHVPVNETVELQMHSTDVIHSFYVPAFLYQRDITPRKDQVIQFTADKIGTYRGQCTQFCGLGHQEMVFEVVVESRADFEKWLASQLSPAPSGSPAASASPAPSASPAAVSGAAAPAH
jgi:cytochrome c oxidase subunit 2